MNFAARKTAEPFRRLRLFAAWIVWLAVVLPSIVFSVYTSFTQLAGYGSEIEKWIYVHLNFGSFIVGVIAAGIIFWRKPTDRLAFIVSLMLVTWTSTSNGFEFWYALGIGGDNTGFLFAYFLSFFYTLLMSILLLYVLLMFPNGNWVPGWTRWIFALSLIGMFVMPVYLCFMLLILNYMPDSMGQFFFDYLPQLSRLGILGMGMLAQVYRLFVTKDPLQRQQLKWIAVSLVGMTFFYIMYWMDNLVFGTATGSFADLTVFFLVLFFTYSFIVTFVISALRYHIWDIDIVINKTLVYSALTTILGALGVTSAVLFELYADQYLKNSPPLIGLLAILPLVILFVPLRDTLQNFVDSRFKPEEIDFSGSIVEFAPEAQLMLTSNDILKILARQVKDQLEVLDVEIYLKHAGGGLVLNEPAVEGADPSLLSLSQKERSVLEKGDAFAPADLLHCSLYLPLTLKRASKPEFLGVMAIGQRRNGAGYSSVVLKSLKKFGVDAGKVLYIAKLRESSGRNIMERLASLEKGLATIKTDLA